MLARRGRINCVFNRDENTSTVVMEFGLNDRGAYCTYIELNQGCTNTGFARIICLLLGGRGGSTRAIEWSVAWLRGKLEREKRPSGAQR